MMRMLRFLAALIVALSLMAELEWITINHAWLARAHALLLKVISTLLYLFF